MFRIWDWVYAHAPELMIAIGLGMIAFAIVSTIANGR